MVALLKLLICIETFYKFEENHSNCHSGATDARETELCYIKPNPSSISLSLLEVSISDKASFCVVKDAFPTQRVEVHLI